jgi:hypothetical protein
MPLKFLRCLSLAAVAAAISIPASAGELKLAMQNGRVTLIADNVPVRQVLLEWARVGQTTIVNAEKLSGSNLTLQLIDTPERDALDIILRSATGYIAAPRTAPLANAALYDRVTIFMSTTRVPPAVASAAPPPTFQRPPQPDDGDDPISVQMPPAMTPNGPMVVAPGIQPMPAAPGTFPQGVQQMPAQQQLPAPMNAPLTSPRPGALPQPQPQPGNPYQPGIRPGGGGPGGTDF